MLVPAGVFTGGRKAIFEHTNGSIPIYFEYPYEKVDDVTIEFPPGWQVSSVPPPQTRTDTLMAYNMKVENGNDTAALDAEVEGGFIDVGCRNINGACATFSR